MPHQKSRQHAPRARWRPAGRARAAPRANGWDPRLRACVAPGLPIWLRGAPRPPEQGRCALHRARGRGAHRAGPWAAACARAGRLQGGDARRRRARSAICGSRFEPHRRPALHSRAGTYTWHRAQQSRWSSARAARRSALRCAYTSAAISTNCPEPTGHGLVQFYTTGQSDLYGPERGSNQVERGSNQVERGLCIPHLDSYRAN